MAHAPLETPRTEAHRAAMENEDFDVELVKTYLFARSLELQLNEARALLTRISDGAEPVLLAEEIEDFLDKTEVDSAG